MDVYCVFICAFCILLTGSAQATALVVSSPRDITVANGTWASFECRVSCTHVFYWFVGSGQYRRMTNVDVNRFMQRNGIQVEISNSDECTDKGDYTQQLRVLATPKVNGTAVQCAAVARPPTPNGVFFSSYAVLKVEPIVPKVPIHSGVATCCSDKLSPEPSPSPSSTWLSSSPLPVLCPYSSPEVLISSVTVTVTKTPPVLTVTSILIRIVTFTPSPSSLPPDPHSNCNDRPSSVSKARAQTVPEIILPAARTTTNSGRPRLSGLSSSIILLSVLLVTALLQL